MNIDNLPKEVLLLVIANLRMQDVRSLALTFNKPITDTCLPLLRALSAKRHNEKYIASLFPRLSKLDFVDIDSLRYRGSLGDLWSRWIDEWDPLDSHQELPRLASLDLPSGSIQNLTRAQGSSTPLTIDQWQTLVEKAQSLDIEMPPIFWKAMSDGDMIDQMTVPDGCYIEMKGFQLLPARMTRGNIGYMLPFLHHPDLEWSWYLYFEPGGEHQHCVLRIDNVLKTTNVDDELMWELLSRLITDEDRQMADLHAVDLKLMDPCNIHLAGFSFGDWLAYRLFNGWLPHPTTNESPETGSGDLRNSESKALPHPVIPRKRVRTNLLRRLFHR